jgi:polar amino acid transport system permease protein
MTRAAEPGAPLKGDAMKAQEQRLHPPQSVGQIPTEVVKVRHPARWITGAVLIVLGAMAAHALVTNKRFEWDIYGKYFASHSILVGLGRTLVLTGVAMLIGAVLGTALAVFRLSRNPVMKSAAGLYIWFFRGTPLLVQLIFWYNLSALYPRLSFGIPFGPEFVSGETNTLVSVWTAAILGLGLNEAAYMAEIIRSGLLSVDRGQTLAAESIGMTDTLMMRRIVLPQALRVIVPPTGNQVIGMLKYTSLVSVVALPELLYSSQLIYTQNFRPIPLLLVASTWYLIVTTVLMVAQSYLERHFGRGFAGGQARGRTRRPNVQDRARLIELESK